MSYEFHGWFSLCENAEMAVDLTQRIDAFRRPGFLVEAGISNGAYLAMLHGLSNHDRNSTELVSLFTHVAELDQDANGVLHLFDDEKVERERHYVMRNGSVTTLNIKVFEEHIL